jgi:hypothetical protein
MTFRSQTIPVLSVTVSVLTKEFVGRESNALPPGASPAGIQRNTIFSPFVVVVKVRANPSKSRNNLSAGHPSRAIKGMTPKSLAISTAKRTDQRSTGERVRHQKVLGSSVEKYNDGPAVPVEKNEIVKGYEYRKGQYVIIEPSELENLKVPSKHTIEVTQFVEANELLPEYIEKPYFVVPEKDSVEAFTVIRKALQKTGSVAIGKVLRSTSAKSSQPR